MSITIRAILDSEIDQFRASLLAVFGFDPATDPTGTERVRALLDLGRTYCAFDGDQLVASAGAFTFDLSIPGAIVPMGGLTMVTVRPTHRRRGILRGIIAAHLADVSAHHEPLSGLWASEGGIYGRFGYGVAAEADELRFTIQGEVAPGRELDEVRLLSDGEAPRELPAIYERARAERPGMFSRTTDWWHYRRFSDRADIRKGRSPRMHVITQRDGKPTGYVVYRQLLAFDEGTAAGQLDIEELVAIDARAEASLYRFAASVDLFPKVSFWNAPTDALLPWLVPDRRAVVRKRRTDTLWLRVSDVARALAARRYEVDGALSLQIDARTYKLTVEHGVARCELSDERPQLALSVAALSTIFMGNTAPSTLARAGLIAGEAPAIAHADRMFRWPTAAWCPEIF
jgi:predicted acetyltransferase